ncbi:MAG: hypothetical protein JSV50_17885 [Desulfobacteraceae bacterium]|nr:MAG: hypothetical protein JSV50_17885 [Desulfobacteraceae bacterium]
MGSLSQMLIARTGSYAFSFLSAAALSIIGAALTLTLKGRKEIEEAIQKQAAFLTEN